MSESDLEARLDAVERALTDGDADLAALDDATDLVAAIEELETRLGALETKVDDLDAAVQAVRGYAGNLRAVNRDVEQRASAALAKAETLETALEDDDAFGSVQSAANGEYGRHGGGSDGTHSGTSDTAQTQTETRTGSANATGSREHADQNGRFGGDTSSQVDQGRAEQLQADQRRADQQRADERLTADSTDRSRRPRDGRKTDAAVPGETGSDTAPADGNGRVGGNGTGARAETGTGSRAETGTGVGPETGVGDGTAGESDDQTAQFIERVRDVL